MNAIRVDTTVDQALAQAVPALRPFVGKKVELIAIEAEPTEEPPRPKISFDELLARRVNAPPGTAPLTDEDIDRAIMEGARRGNV